MRPKCSHLNGPLVLAFVICTLAAGNAAAQTQSLFGNRGPASQIGSNLSGSRVGSGTTFGSSFGTGLNASPITGGVGGAGGTGLTGSSASGLVGRADNANRFVGNQRVGGQNSSTTSSRQFGNRSAGRRETPFGTRQFGSQTATRRPVIRPRHEIAFAYPARTGAAVRVALTNRFKHLIQRRPGLRRAVITLDEDGTAVLRGNVDSLAAKKLAAIIIRLEPGVRDVRNELTVQQK